VSITEFFTKDRIEALVQRTKFAGAEIVSLLKTGSAYYAPAAAIFHMVKSIIQDENRVLPCGAYLEGEYGVSDVLTGVPVILGRQGIEKIIELKLTPEEKADFINSVDAVKALMKKL
jgi:malate dehydrogenase